jgi:hypothetical protein
LELKELVEKARKGVPMEEGISLALDTTDHWRKKIGWRSHHLDFV